MMRRAYVTVPIAVTAGEGSPCEIPAGLCWVLERTHWIALTWGAAADNQQVELPLRDYVSHIQSGRIHFGHPSPPPTSALNVTETARATFTDER